MYRLTIYKQNHKDVVEYKDEDELKDAVDGALNDIENKAIKTFSVSWLSDSTFVTDKPYWE